MEVYIVGVDCRGHDGGWEAAPRHDKNGWQVSGCPGC